MKLKKTVFLPWIWLCLLSTLNAQISIGTNPEKEPITNQPKTGPIYSFENARFLRSGGTLITPIRIAFSPNGKSIASLGSYKSQLKVRFWDIEKCSVVWKLDSMPRGFEKFNRWKDCCFSKDGKYVLASASNGAYSTCTLVFDATTGELLRTFAIGGDLAVHPKTGKIALARMENLYKRQFHTLDPETGKSSIVLSSHRGFFPKITFDSSDQIVNIIDESKWSTLNLRTGSLTNQSQAVRNVFESNIGFVTIQRMAVHTGRNLIAFKVRKEQVRDETHNTIVVLDRTNMSVIRAIPDVSYYTELHFTADGTELVFSNRFDRKDVVSVINIDSGETRRLPFVSQQPIHLHPNEKFYVQPSKSSGLVFVDFETGQRIGQFMTVMKNDIGPVARLTNGKWFGNTKPDRTIRELATGKDATGQVQSIFGQYLAADKAATTKYVKRFEFGRNSKSIVAKSLHATASSFTRTASILNNKIVASNNPKDGLIEIPLARPGVSGILRIVAQKADGPIVAETIRLEGGKISKKRQSRRLFLFGVGVSDYKIDDYDLDFCDSDVKETFEVLKKQKGLAYDDVVVMANLFNEKATRISIESALPRLKTCTPNDTLVLFFSCHGIRKKRGLYLLPHNGDELSIADTCINWSTIAETIITCNAGQIILVNDCCHAGAFAKDSAITPENIIATLKRKQNLCVISASRAGEESLEFKSLRHGVLSDSLINALNGQADMNSDSALSIGEIASYVEKKVPEKTNERQHSTFFYGNGFDKDNILLLNLHAK